MKLTTNPTAMLVAVSTADMRRDCILDSGLTHVVLHSSCSLDFLDWNTHIHEHGARLIDVPLAIKVSGNGFWKFHAHFRAFGLGHEIPGFEVVDWRVVASSHVPPGNPAKWFPTNTNLYRMRA